MTSDSDQQTRPCGTPDGQHCTDCNGTHAPATGITFVTAHNWWTK